jgi:hypothetical protein
MVRTEYDILFFLYYYYYYYIFILISSLARGFTNMDDKQIRQRFYEYLISATLKDCSIIFSVRKSGEIDIGQQSHFRYLPLFFMFFFRS